VSSQGRAAGDGWARAGVTSLALAPLADRLVLPTTRPRVLPFVRSPRGGAVVVGDSQI
jgi:hypothetical protein